MTSNEFWKFALQLTQALFWYVYHPKFEKIVRNYKRWGSTFCPKDSGRNRATDGERFTDRHLANENRGEASERGPFSREATYYL